MIKIGIPRFTNGDSFAILNIEIDTEEDAPFPSCETLQRLDTSPIRPKDLPLSWICAA